MVRIELVDILETIPGTVHSSEVPVSDVFTFFNGVVVEATFPIPTT